MAAVLPLLALVAAVGSAQPVGLGHATARTTAAGTAQFTLTVSASFSGAVVRTQSRGAISFRLHRAHVYKLVLGEPAPEEQIVSGPWTYSNANVAAAAADPRVKPWTKVDTRRLPAAQRLGELDHARAMAYLAAGVAAPRRIGASGTLTHFSGTVDPTRALAAAPASQRAALRQILRADYATGRFPADFWLDRTGRVRRVRVAYSTAKGTSFTLVGTFSGFGSRVDVTPPPARETLDITPR